VGREEIECEMVVVVMIVVLVTMLTAAIVEV
jgi:hypothetical protein